MTVVVLCVAADGASVAAGERGRPGSPAITHGVIVGDVTASTALLWARTDREAILNVTLSRGRHGRLVRAPARAGDDFTASAQLARLAPGTRYRYRAWFSLGSTAALHGRAVEGTFQTAPEPGTAAPLRLDFGATSTVRTSAATRPRGCQLCEP